MSLTSMFEAAARGGTVEVESGWTQGRAIYGGLTGGLLLAAIKGRLREAAGDRAGSAASHPLRSLTVSFIGPATTGPVEIDAEILRVGSNVTQCQATLRQDGAIVATALAAFGRHRESSISVTPAHPMPDMPAAESIEAFPYIEDFTPEFYRFVELRQAGGSLPFSGAETGGLSGWSALREAPEEFHEEHLVVLADAWPPAAIQMLSGFAPASSLTWTLELVAEVGPDTIPPESVFAYEATTDAARDGYAHTHAMMWRPDGSLIAISRQTITVFG
ncbi:thioesterase family protein [Rhodococcus sp. IEGM 1408]|uniref:thioesterase family protein n=1 Tax=Rhodococcus sp. IEGM 1408 TaxID=3082220 RepID=UPI002953D8A2|nr:thioesterase family protein [Rhodococcus sp. IEGM 1408]MDV7999845.1 thioesterase family protein [Rhodococcus sp. IEGM 1408]